VKIIKILIVEDSLLYRKAIVKYLKKYLVDTEYLLAKDGEEGYEKYRQEKPEIIILDLLMPKLGGQELLAKIREEDKEIKAIIISANVQKIIKKELNNLGILKFINKPFTEEKAAQLAKSIKGVITK
jgi:CheY-like chemotaxis protein